jgi:hypothetical protein
MKKLTKIILVFLIGLLITTSLKAQKRPIDRNNKTDYFGITTMFLYSYRDWVAGDKAEKGSLRFDSFRIWAQTDIDKKIFAAVQFRFYEGWQTPTHLYIGYHINDNNTLQLGHTWVPFGIGYQPFDDWGNIAFYVGLQDDYDYGITWEANHGILKFHAGFFKNQQLSSSSTYRYDTDIFSGGLNDDYLISMEKNNEEVNQLNLRLELSPSINNIKMDFGLSGMAGQIYSKSQDENGTRYAAALHAAVNINKFHFNAQQTWYNYTQILADSATQDQLDFINVSSWGFAYEIPVSADIFSASAAYDIIGDKLSIHANYSYLWGGTSQASSQLITAGVRTIWDTFEVFAEVYHGINDPQLSGISSGYGRNFSSSDLRIDVRFFYKIKVISDKSIALLKKKLSE